jgi:pimeloyl-ACP methyl ester carboxylesterase
MTFRLTPHETEVFFAKKKVAYLDSTITVDGHPIHYIQTGRHDRTTLFFVHGSPGSWNAFQKYLTDSLLLRKFRMVAIDRPGFGYSRFGKAENLATQTAWVSEFIDRIDNRKPVILVGHSLGGPFIAKLAADRPSRFARLVILSGAIDPAAEKTEGWRSIAASRPIRYLVPGAFRPSNDELWYLKTDLIALEPRLKRITCDVTVVHGTEDALVPFRNVRFMEKAFSAAKSVDIIAIKGANHFIPWENYDEIRDRLLEF